MKKNIGSLFISLFVLMAGVFILGLLSTSVTSNELGWILSGSTMGVLITYFITITGYES